MGKLHKVLQKKVFLGGELKFLNPTLVLGNNCHPFYQIPNDDPAFLQRDKYNIRKFE